MMLLRCLAYVPPAALGPDDWSRKWTAAFAATLLRTTSRHTQDPYSTYKYRLQRASQRALVAGKQPRASLDRTVSLPAWPRKSKSESCPSAISFLAMDLHHLGRAVTAGVLWRFSCVSALDPLDDAKLFYPSCACNNFRSILYSSSRSMRCWHPHS